MSKDIVERLLLDNMADEVFILQTLKDVDAETRDKIRRALDNIAARSRHIGQQLIEVVRSDGREKCRAQKKKHIHTLQRWRGLRCRRRCRRA